MRTVKLKVQLQYSSAYHVDIVCHLNIAYCIFMLYMYYECIDMYCICFTGVKLWWNKLQNNLCWI